MNVYDFDDTIYNGDSSKDFILFEMKRHLGSFTKRCLPMCISTILYMLHIHTKETWKSSMFSFLNLYFLRNVCVMPVKKILSFAYSMKYFF